MASTQFHQAIQRLATDEGYRASVEADPKQLLRDFQLTPGELGLVAAVREAAFGAPDVQGYGTLEDIGEWLDEYLCCY